jgi:hypothetical protein
MIVIIIVILVDEFFIIQQVEIEILFQWVMYFLRMEYVIKLKLFKAITFIVTVKLINKIIRST